MNTALRIQPEDSRIERRDVSEHERLYQIPASGTSRQRRFSLGCAILWNVLSLPAWFMCLNAIALVRAGEFITLLMASIFPAVGVGLAYIAVYARYATHLLYLSRDLVRLQRSVIWKSTHDLPAADVDAVKLVEFYQQNYKPVLGIEISAGRRRIRFGSLLTEPEKSWLCAEIRSFLLGKKTR